MSILTKAAAFGASRRAVQDAYSCSSTMDGLRPPTCATINFEARMNFLLPMYSKTSRPVSTLHRAEILNAHYVHGDLMFIYKCIVLGISVMFFEIIVVVYIGSVLCCIKLIVAHRNAKMC
jgi:hypothetical protein